MGTWPSHLVRLGCERWGCWRWVALRGAGFPAELVLCLADPELAETADQLAAAHATERIARKGAVDALYAFAGACGPASGRGASTDAVMKRDLAVKAKRVIEHGGLASPLGCDAAVDAAIAALREAHDALQQETASFEGVYEARRTRLSSVVAGVLEDERFREAVTWQNREALQRIESRPNLRKSEELVASYLQRYATKNDTIGFFGPVGWAKLAEEGPALAVVPGASLLANRTVHFEHWAIDALAEELAREPRIQPWMAPRRYGFVRLEGTSALSPLSVRQDLSAEEAAVLRACDGRSTVRELVARFVESSQAAFRSESDLLASIRMMHEKRLVSFTLEVPLRAWPETRLRALLDRVGDDELRTKALGALASLEDARRKIASAAGNPHALAAALAELDQVFTQVTSRAATRHAGRIYAARTLVFEDCRRAVDISVGPSVLDRAAPALVLLLTSANWFTHEVACVHRREFRRIYDQLSTKLSTRVVPFADFWFAAQRLLFASRRRPIDACIQDLQERWSRILAVDSQARGVEYASEALRPRVEEEFGSHQPGWSYAAYHCPDLMVAAPSVEAVEEGRYRLVLGELHVATNSIDYLVYLDQHPSPSERVEAVEVDVPNPRVVPVTQKDWPNITLRSCRALLSARDYFLDTGQDPSGAPPEHTLGMAELVVEPRGEELSVRSVERSVTFDIIELLGEVLGPIVQSAFRVLPKAAHAPRLVIDQLVVARETWTFDAPEIPFDATMPESEVFVSARRWMHERGLPRFAFVKVAIEPKPFFVDFTSPILLNQFARVVGRAKRDSAGRRSVAVSEMLPSFDDLWLHDADGRRYTSELRIVAVDTNARGTV